jgi:DNA-binding CsgD family transcriptional regulator
LYLRHSEEPVIGSADETISWDNIQTTSADEPADNHLKVENCGNADFSSVSITGQDLTGTGGNTDTIEPDSFYVDETSSPCSLGQQINNPPSELIITNTALAKGTGAGIPSENIYFCLKDINPVSGPSPVKVDSYSSSTAWDILVNGIMIPLIKFIRFNFEFSILLSLVVLRTKKKRKKKLKTKNNFLSYEELLSLDSLLKKNYNINVKELLRKSKEKEIKKKLVKIPLNIFNKKLSPAEALCKYLKENKKMKFSEIAKLINRDERSIWTNYNNAVKKIKEKIKDEKKVDKSSLVFVNVFADRRLSILESVVKHLKEKGYRNYKIAELLGKDQRNIYTICHRINKKLN